LQKIKLTLQQLKEASKIPNYIKTTIGKDRSWGNNESWEYFIYGMSFLSSQAFAPRIENRFIRENGLVKVKASDGRGDCRNANGIHFEYKCSLLMHDGSNVNIVQIRPWQEVDYIVEAFDIRSEEFVRYTFLLTNNEMHKELDLTKAGYAHGTRESGKNNTNNEYAIRFEISDQDKIFDRWKVYQRSIDKFVLRK